MTAPFLIKVLPNISGYKNRDLAYRWFILGFTFLCYTSYHLSRKPISVVKSVLHHKNCSSVHHPNTTNTSNAYWCDWSPFNHDNYSDLFGTLDLCYLISYALAMFLSGHVADRSNLRLYLSSGMIMSGVFTIGFGLGYFYDIHVYSYYVAMQIIGGAFQATGWPGVVACVGNWFGKGKRGLIMGIWNAHTSVGNILGSVIAGAFVESDWGLSFAVPGTIIAGMGILVFFFLVPHPKDVDCILPDHSDNNVVGIDSEDGKTDIQNSVNVNKEGIQERQIGEGGESGGGENQLYVKNNNVKVDGDKEPKLSPSGEVKETNQSTTVHIVSRNIDTEADTEEERMVRAGESTALIPNRRHVSSREKPITIFRAVLIPGVAEFAMCLFFAKLVSYTFLYWLPNYITNKEPNVSPSTAAYTSTIFDAGGIVGGIVAGYVSDRLRLRGTTCVVFLVLAAPMLYIYNAFGSEISFSANCVLLAVCGMLVNGPYALITTAVSADLGTHKTVRDSSKALGMVTAIIDGTGSIGAAIGPLLTGIISNWQNVFYMLITADVLAGLLLTRVVIKEIKQKRQGFEDDVTIIVPRGTYDE